MNNVRFFRVVGFILSSFAFLEIVICMDHIFIRFDLIRKIKFSHTTDEFIRIEFYVESHRSAK